MAWSPAGPWIREYVGAVRAMWDCWQNGTPLDVQGPHYNINLTVPLFNPGPIEHPRIPIQLAAVNAFMSQVVGEVADGLRAHPVCTPSYIEKVMLPAVRAGAAKTGRSLADFQVCMKPLVAAAATEEELSAKIRDVRARVSFYASTPQYRAAFDHHGLGDLADRLKLLSRAQRWEEMPQHITDDILADLRDHRHLRHDRAQSSSDRYGGVVTHCEFSIPVKGAADKERLRDLARTIQAESLDKARRAIRRLRRIDDRGLVGRVERLGRAGPDQFGKAFVGHHHGEAIEPVRPGILDHVLHARRQHQRIALRDVVGLAVAVGAAAAAQHVEHLVGILVCVGRGLAADLEDLHHGDEGRLVDQGIDHHHELVRVGRRDARDPAVAGAA